MTLYSGGKLKVLFVASEIAPLVKTGGLGDVAGSLPPALTRLGLEVRLVMPLHRQVDRQRHGLRPTGLVVRAAAGGREYAAQVWETRLDGCPVHLLDCPELFDREGLYGPPGGDFADNPLRYTWFCRAAIELARALDFAADVVHAHDWQTALIMAYLEAGGWDPGPLRGAATVFTIHNLAYQGIYERGVFGLTGLPAWLDSPQGLEFWGNCSLLKAGLVCARALTTVSPTYAQEITTAHGGHGMEGVLLSRREALTGILNGVDYAVWSPENDPWLPAAYSAQDLAGKAACRDALLESFGLEPAGPSTAVIGYVGRLAHQKGVDLFPPALPHLLLDDVRICILGSGEHRHEHDLMELAARHPGRAGVRIAFSEELAHLITAGCDLLLMPSRYEPCGLNQIYALRYGAAPVVRATGGLRDTVEPLDPLAQTGTGFLFEGFGVRELLCAAREGLWAKARPDVWRGLQARGMGRDFSWDQSARRYAELYARLRGL
ncbi:MAG: glycogen synthase GlgA [Thermodesulfobacteriota bacterium]